MTRKTHGQALVCLRWTMAPWTVPVHVVLAPLSQMTRKTHGQALVCLMWTMTSWTVLVHVVLAPLSQMTRKTHGQAPVCLRWTTASARRPTLDSIRVYVHDQLSAQLPSLMAGTLPFQMTKKNHGQALVRLVWTTVWTFHLVLPWTQSTFISHPCAISD